MRIALLKNNFKKLLDKFYANGVLKEVYASEHATVCNAFNQFYIAFSNDLVEQYDGRFPGFSMNSAGLRHIVEDDDFVNRYFGNLSSKEQDQVLVLLDEKLLHHFISHKGEFSRRPPKAGMDLAYEQQVMAMQGKQGELASMLEEQQAQSLAATQQKGVSSQK